MYGQKVFLPFRKGHSGTVVLDAVTAAFCGVTEGRGLTHSDGRGLGHKGQISLGQQAKEIPSHYFLAKTNVRKKIEN